MSSTRFLFFLAFVACGGSTPTPTHPAIESPPTASAADIDQDAVADLFEHHRHHHYGGITMFVAMSLDTLGLSPDQRATFSTMQKQLYAKMNAARDAENAVLGVLVDGISAGAIDRAKVDAAIERLRQDAGTVHEAASGTVNALHEALSPEQRATLADKVEAHWMVWRQANPSDEANRPRGQLALVASAIALTPEQIDAVRHRFGELMRQAPALDVERVTTKLHAFETAFASATFDAHAMLEATIGSHLAGFGATRLARFCEALAPVLTPEQRTKLVDLLREHQTHGENDVDAR